MVHREPINLDVYQDFDSIFPLEYFELRISSTKDGKWLLIYLPEQGQEQEFGPYTPVELTEAIAEYPFHIEPIVFVYYLVESSHQEISDLGVELLKYLAQA